MGGFIPEGFEILQEAPDVEAGPSSANLSIRARMAMQAQVPPLDLRGVRPWSDISNQLDPMMAKEEYDAVREKYFYDNIAPRLQRSRKDVKGAYELFKKKTDRAPILKGVERVTAPITQGLLSAGKEIIAPAATLGVPGYKEALEETERRQKELDTTLRREGLPSAGPQIAGTLIGAGVPIAALSAIAGPAAAELAGGAFQSAKAINLATKIARGSATFGAYEALREQDADLRLTRAMQGATIGAVFDGGLALLGMGRAAKVDRAIERLKTGDLPTNLEEAQVDALLAESTKVSTEAGARMGKEVSINVGQSDKAVMTLSRSRAGKTLQREVSLKAPDTVKDLNTLLDDGWAIDMVNVGEENYPLYQEIKSQLGKRFENDYVESVINVTDKAARVAEIMRGKGVPATALDESRVMVKSALSTAKWSKQPPIRVINEEVQRMVKAGLDITPEEQIRIQTSVVDAWNLKPGPIRDAAIEDVRKYLPNMVPPDPATGAAKVLQGKLRPEPIPDRIKNTEGILAPSDVSAAVRTKVSGIDGLWSPSLKTNLTREEVENLAMDVWNPAAGVKTRAVATRKLKEVFPEILPENFPLLPQGMKEALKIPEEILAAPMTTAERAAARKALQRALSAEEETALSELSGERREAIMKAMEEDLPLDIPPGESEEIAKVMEEEINRGIAGPAAEKRGVRRAPRANRPEEPLSMAGPLLVGELKAEGAMGLPRRLPGVIERPLYYTAELPPSHPLFEGGQVTGKMFEQAGDFYILEGASRSSIPERFWGKPLIAVPKKGWTAYDLYHEGVHAINGASGFDWMANTQRRGVGMGIGLGLRKAYGPYRNINPKQMMNEAFTHAATAVRYGNQRVLMKLARWDTSVNDVVKFVHDNAEVMARHTLKAGDSILTRRGQRVFNDLRRRTAEDVFLEIDRAYWGPGYTYFDKNSNQWLMRYVDGIDAPIKRFSNTKDMWDEFLRLEGVTDTVPNYSSVLEDAGIGGPLVPEHLQPRGRPLPIATTPVDLKSGEAAWGWQALRGWFRPFFAWTATLDSKLNKFYATRGQQFPLNNLVRNVDDMHRAGLGWTRDQQNTLYEALKGVKQEKHRDLFEWLTYDEADRAAATNKFKLSRGDIEAALKFENWGDRYRQDTGINVKEYMKVYYPQLRENGFNPNTVKQWARRYDPKAAGFFEKTVHEAASGASHFNPQDNHLGRFAHWLIEQGMQKKFTGEPLKQLDKLVNKQSAEGKYLLGAGLRGPLNNYINYMKGYPDQTQQALNNALGRFQSSVSNRIREINKRLPKKWQLEEWESPPQQTINRLLLLSYTAGLAGRPAANLRDLMQGLVTGMTVIGPKRYWGTIGRLMSDRAVLWDRATEAGAMLGRYNIGELWGDIYQELPTGGSGLMNKLTRASNVLLQPQRWTDNFNRAVIFNSEHELVMKGLRLYRNGQIDARKFIEEYSTLWWNDESNITRMLDYATKKFEAKPVAIEQGRTRLLSPEKAARAKLIPEAPEIQMKYKGITASSEEEYMKKVADKIANELVDLTMWPYRKGGQPAVLRTGLGRIFGQYGMYPMNYIDFMRRGTAKFISNPTLRGRVVKTAALWGAVNYGAVEGMESMGAEASQWFWASPGAYMGGPNLQFTQDLLQSFESSDDGRAARARVLRHPVNFIPLSGATRNIIRSLSEESGNEGLLSPAVVRILGLRPLEIKDEDLAETIKSELGFGPAYRR